MKWIKTGSYWRQSWWRKIGLDLYGWILAKYRFLIWLGSLRSNDLSLIEHWDVCHGLSDMRIGKLYTAEFTESEFVTKEDNQ